MPIYKYTCNKCNKEQSLLIFSGDIPECEGCGSRDLEKKPPHVAMHGNSSGTEPENHSHSSGGSCSSCGGHNCSSCSG